MRTYKLVLLTTTLVIATVLAGCSASDNLLTATFRDSANVARGWVEGCIADDAAKVMARSSQGMASLPDVCSYLSATAKSTQISVLAVEDRSSLISSGELYVIVQDKSSSKRATFRLLLANSEDGPVVYWADYCDSTSWDCRSSRPANLWD